MEGMKLVPEILIFNQLTQFIAREDFFNESLLPDSNAFLPSPQTLSSLFLLLPVTIAEVLNLYKTWDHIHPFYRLQDKSYLLEYCNSLLKITLN
jgi:hypothetical protein